MIRCAIVALLSVACGRASEQPSTVTRPAPAPAPTPAPASATPIAAAAPPVPVRRTGKAWPFHTWDHAEAIAFNQFFERRTQLHVYNESGWSPFIAERKPLDPALAQEAFALVAATEGDVEVSKCPFPRHAVVLYDHDVPVASINVCFTCGDIMLWPRWQPEPDYEHLTPAQDRALERQWAKQAKLYDKTFPRWQKFFRDKVGFDINKRFPPPEPKRAH